MNHTGLFLLPSLFYYTSDKVIKYCWNNKYRNRRNFENQTLFDEPTDDQKKLVFGIQNERVWKSKFNEKMSKPNFSSENFDELNNENNKINECDDDKINKKTYKHLNVHSFNPYMDTVSTLFQKATTNVNIPPESTVSIESTDNLIKWDICVKNYEIILAVFNKHNTGWNLINRRIENYYDSYYNGNEGSDYNKLIASSLFNNNDIVILTTFGILIYSFNENDKSISLNYFYFMKFDIYKYTFRSKYKKKIFQHYKEIFSKSTLPSPNYDSFKLDSWVSVAKNNKLNLLKCGVELLTFAIKEHKLELIDDIYKKCMTYFKEDLMNNKSFLSIITSTMPLLDEYYPEYILKYSSETNMIIDSSFYSIEHQNKNLHLYSFFQSPQIDNLSQSLLWTKCCYKGFCSIDKTFNKENLFSILMYFLLFIIYLIQVLIIFLILPLYLATFYILSKYKFINNIYTPEAFSSVYFTAELFIFKKKHNNTNNYFYGSLY
jgi:hypothetical protein